MSLFLSRPRPFMSFLLQEALSTVLQSSPDASVEGALSTAHVLAGRPVPAPADMLALAQRIAAQRGGPPVKEEVEARGSGLGRAMQEWMGGLPTDQLCLLACDLDLDRARRLYCDTDVEDAETVLSLYMTRVWHQARAQFEATLVGFGGELGGSSDVPTTRVDMNDNAQVTDMISDLKSMGF